MVLHQTLPAALRYTHELCDTVNSKNTLGISHAAENALLEQLSANTDALYQQIEALKNCLKSVPATAVTAAAYYHSAVIPAMNALRATADTLETLTDKSYWPYPTYSDLLYY